MALNLSRRSADGVAFPGDEEFISGIKQAELVRAAPQAV